MQQTTWTNIGTSFVANLDAITANNNNDIIIIIN